MGTGRCITTRLVQSSVRLGLVRICVASRACCWCLPNDLCRVKKKKKIKKIEADRYWHVHGQKNFSTSTSSIRVGSHKEPAPYIGDVYRVWRMKMKSVEWDGGRGCPSQVTTPLCICFLYIHRQKWWKQTVCYDINLRSKRRYIVLK
jgi:hypothetical protein